MKIIITLFLILYYQDAFSFGKSRYVYIDMEKCGDSLFGEDCNKNGYKPCLRGSINVEVYDSNRSNYKWVVISCLPSFKPIVKYWKTDQEALEFIQNVTGEKDSQCMTGNGVEDCKK